MPFIVNRARVSSDTASIRSCTDRLRQYWYSSAFIASRLAYLWMVLSMCVLWHVPGLRSTDRPVRYHLRHRRPKLGWFAERPRTTGERGASEPAPASGQVRRARGEGAGEGRDDTGVIVEQDTVTITGRSKDIVLLGGENICPREIEASHGGLDAAHPDGTARAAVLRRTA